MDDRIGNDNKRITAVIHGDCGFLTAVNVSVLKHPQYLQLILFMPGDTTMVSAVMDLLPSLYRFCLLLGIVASTHCQYLFYFEYG